MKKHVLLGAAMLSFFLGAQMARATQSDNHGIHAVPAPGKIAIDGKLDDWDLSGQVTMCYDIESLADIYSAKVAMMYDAEALYVGIHWVDRMPMTNSHSPRYQAEHAWAGDCAQLRIKTDEISHVTTWYYAPTDEPGMTISRGKDLTHPFGGENLQIFRTQGWKMDQGVEMAFRKDDDGKGYTQEIKLPWKVISKEREYKAGDEFKCGFELLWGQTDWPVHRYADNLAEGASSREFFFTNIPAWGSVVLEPKGHLTLPTPPYVLAMREREATHGPAPITYDLPRDGRVTLAIDDQNGKRIRNLVPALARTKGANTEYWDGLDDSGKPVVPGTYAYKAIYHDPVHVNWAMSFASPGNPSWDTPDGKGAFYGDHSAPEAVAAGGDFVAIACPIGEAGKHLIGCDLKGQRLWGIANRGAFFAGRISLATDGKILYVSQDKTGTIYRVNMADGQYSPWNLMATDALGTEFQVLDLGVASAHESKKGEGINVSQIALHSGVLAVALAMDNKVKLLDAQTGASKGEFTVEEPVGVTFDKDGGLIVLSKGRLVRIGADGKTAAFNDGIFANGFALASDPAGNIYLSVRGSDQNVKVFTFAGKLDHEIGKRGGRPNPGPFDDNGMCQPGQIALDSQGRLWVTEERSNPKRTSIWAADGKFLFDLVGTTTYAGSGAINPDDPTMAFSDDTVYKLDWTAGTSRPVSSLGKSESPDDIFGTGSDSHNRVMTHDGRTYVYTTDRNGDVNCMMLKDGKWLSVAHVGTVNSKDRDFPARYEHPVFAGHEGQVYAWADKNADGLVQADEVTFATPSIDGRPAKFQGCYWGQLPGPDGTISYFDPESAAIVELPIVRWNSAGSPVYDVANPRIIKTPEKIVGKNLGMIFGGQDGTVYLNQSPLTAIDKEGRILFTYPSNHISTHGSHTATSARPGYLIGPSSILGTADMGGDTGEIFDINGNLGENYMYTRDGLFIQAVFKDTRGWFDSPLHAQRGMSMDATTAGGESFGGNFVRTKDGHVYLTIGGTDARVLEVTGLDTIHRFAGKFEYTNEEFGAAQKINQAAAARAQESKSVRIAKAPTPMRIDGKADQWPELLDETKTAITIQDSPQDQFARVGARYDNDNLYLAYRVHSGASRMRNGGQDERLLFKTGDAVDLMIGPEKSKGGEGNARLLLSMMKDKTVAVIYQKIAAGAATEQKVPFSSPWRTITFDRVARADEVKFTVGPIAGGYLVEAAIPWKTLGIEPKSGLKLRGDIGVLFSDGGGTTTVSRKYWSNKATGLVNDVPGEADLTPELWGEFELE